MKSRSAQTPRIGYHSAMTSEKQTESQSVRQGTDLKPQRILTDSDIEELISFFQLLAKWDREAKALEPCKKTEDAPSNRDYLHP
jgi:hypothetical protein